MLKVMFFSLLCGIIAAFFFIVYLQALYRRDQEADKIKKLKELRRRERVAKLKKMLDKIEHPENYPDENEEGEEGEENEEGTDGEGTTKEEGFVEEEASEVA